MSDMDQAFQDLRGLRTGWLDGEGEAPDPEGLTWLEGWLRNQVAQGLPTPYLYPTPEGGVSAEWDDKQGFRGDLYINLQEHTGDWFDFIEDTDETLLMDDPTAVARWRDRIASRVG